MVKDALKSMLDRYKYHSRKDYENALKEIIQEITLLGLWRAKFFEKVAFYGGTALRIMHGLDRFSEDIDFSLLKPDSKFKLEPYLSSIKSELSSFGLEVSIEEKKKSRNTNIESAFIKVNTKIHFIKVQAPPNISQHVQQSDLLKIKLEVDIDPPGNFLTEAKNLLQPIPFSVNTMELPDLFAGKVHAILTREWKNRVKGRDWYDFVWLISRKTSLRLAYLQACLIQSGKLSNNVSLNQQNLSTLLLSKIESLDIDKAKEDVKPFLKDTDSIKIWSKNFLKDLTKQIKTI